MNNKLAKAVIIGGSIIFTALILGNAFKKRNENLDTISVVGLGTKDFVSDEICGRVVLLPKVSKLKKPTVK